MDGLNRRLITLAAAFAVLTAVFFLIQTLFAGRLSERRLLLEEKQAMLSSMRGILAAAENGDPFFEKYASFSQADANKDEALNAWISEIVAFGKSENILFQELDPRKEKENGGRGMRLSLAFKGNIRSLLLFLNYVFEKEPFVKIDFLSVKAGESRRIFEYSLSLERSL